VVKVCVADEQYFDVAEMKAQLFDTLFDLIGRAFQIAIDQDVSLRGRNEESSQVPASDVIHVSDNVVRRKGRGPIRVGLRIEMTWGRRKQSAHKE
jgi:hypothetical protein